MNNPHKNARTTPLGRVEMIRRILEEGRPVCEVAAGFGVSERTARKWLARWKSEGSAGLENRSSRPRTVANRLADAAIAVIEHLRREYRLTAEAIAAKLTLARSTVAGWLQRQGIGGLSEVLCLRPSASLDDEPVAEDDGKLGPGLEPLARRPFPLVGLAIEDQI